MYQKRTAGNISICLMLGPARSRHGLPRARWCVSIERVDAKNRRIWFRGSGKNAGQDPYLVHYYRVNFDGTGLVALTEGNGDHYRQQGLNFSPDGKYIIDTYSAR